MEVNTTISTRKQTQLEHEINTWERSVLFFRQENAQLKTRLSVVTDNNNEKEFVELAEYFQSQFLLIDEIIYKLRIEIKKQSDDIRINPQGKKLKELLSNQELIRKKMICLENDFSRLKNEFNQLIMQFI